MKSKLSGSLNLVTNDIYEWVTPSDRKILKNPQHDFDLITKLDHWRDVNPSNKLKNKDDIRAFYAG